MKSNDSVENKNEKNNLKSIKKNKKLNSKKKKKNKLKNKLEISDSNQTKAETNKRVETTTTTTTTNNHTNSNQTKTNNKKPNEPFRRVKEDELDSNYLEKFGKNTFQNKKGAKGSWGERANNDLVHTRGKSFRNEKNKKKRGSYRGGRIDTNVCSIKFDDSD